MPTDEQLVSPRVARAQAAELRVMRCAPDPEPARMLELGDALALLVRTGRYYWNVDAVGALRAARGYQSWRRLSPNPSQTVLDLLDDLVAEVLAEAAIAEQLPAKTVLAEDWDAVTADWPTVNGRKVAPYALPPDPVADALELHDMMRRAQNDRDHARLRFRQALENGIAHSKRQRGLRRELTIANRLTIELHRKRVGSGERFAVEVYRAQRWSAGVEFWRAR